MDSNSNSEINLAARIFLQAHDRPYMAARKLAESARQAGLLNHYRYWTKIGLEIQKLMF
jgi:hypothetical protein